MRTKWKFRNEPSQDISVTPAFACKSFWKPPLGHPNLEVFLSQVESEFFIETQVNLRYSNLPQEEWRAGRSLADDSSIFVKKADKGSCVVVWDRWDYIKEAEKRLGDSTVYKEINYNKKILSQLVSSSNKYFRKVNSSGYISYKEMKYFTHEYKKACNLGKLYLLPKIHKRIFNVPGRQVTSNCVAPTEKVSEFLVHHLKHVMQKGLSYIRDSQHFLEKIKTIGSVPENGILVTANVVGLYPSIPHQAGLKAFKETLKKRDIKNIPTENLVKMAKFVLNNNIFEFNSKAYQQKSGGAIGTKFALPYACI